MEEWNGFVLGEWNESIDVANFIKLNITRYDGDEKFLSAPTDRTKNLLKKFEMLLEQERSNNGVLSIDVDQVSSLLSYKAGYIDKDNELIVGMQTEKPLERGVNPFGGMRMAQEACNSYGYELSDTIKMHFKYKTTHNDGVFRVYTDEMKKLRKHGVLTGLPDAYGRGRIIGDYRRVALYGIDKLIEEKIKDNKQLSLMTMTEEVIRLREELYRQIDFLKKLKTMAQMYGDDISMPAANARQAIQWIYYAYLGAIKEQNGAAMSLGRVSSFIDIYLQRDLFSGTINESLAQELVDQFVLKLRMSRQLRTPEYNELFAGDPTWVTESIGGIDLNGNSMVTKSSYRFLHTLYNLNSAPEPNLTILWSKDLPQTFKEYCAKVSMDTSSIQYENDDLMRPIYGDDYGIACCVSAMTIGKQMQYFGARCNLAKLLLVAINGGRDETDGEPIAPSFPAFNEGVLDYEKVNNQFKSYIKWLCHTYVNTMNVIHYMHDKYAYEKLQMSLHDTIVDRLMAFGIAGIGVVADSLSAIKYAKVTPITDKTGLVVDYNVDGDFPKYGNDDDRVDNIAKETVEYFYEELTKTPAYRNAIHTLSLLTITSNVVYGKKTGASPCGRKSGEPFAPGANPQHNREHNGALSSLNSVAKICYSCCRDGISNTFSIVPHTLGVELNTQKSNLVSILDGYFLNQGHHLNINFYDRQQLLKAHEAPQLYPNLTIRVSGYAVKFGVLSRKHREEVLSRTFFDNL